MKHVGDITKLNGAEIEPVWCVCGGSPCQDLSVAGKRAGLAGERSGLFMEQIRIIKEMRSVERYIGGTAGEAVRLPRYAVWENVPGAFSSNDGRDFLAVLEEFARCAEPGVSIPRPAEVKGKLKWDKSGVIIGDGYSVAWRTHDAQFFGVPQRRRRICVLTDFCGYTAPDILMEYLGDAQSTDRKQTVVDIGRGRRPEIQSQSDSLSGNTSQSCETWEGSAGDAEKGLGEDGGDLEYF